MANQRRTPQHTQSLPTPTTLRPRETTSRQNSATGAAAAIGQPDDHTALYRQAKQRQSSEEAHANHQLVPGLCAGAVHDHLIATGSNDLLLALRATQYANVDRAPRIKHLVGDAFPRLLAELPGIQQQEQLTSLISALQWWAGQPAATVAISPSTTVILVHVPSAEAPILLHIGTKRPRVAHYVQQYAGKQTIRQ